MWKSPIPLLLLLAGPLCAQAPEPGETAPTTRRALRAAPATGQVRIDGRFDEIAWLAADPATDFTQSYPRPGTPASERTEVRVLTGLDALYVAARMYDSRPDSIAAQLSRRDALGTYSDRILVFIDSHNDRRTAFHFGVNPRGVKQDTYQFNDVNEDRSWDAVWDVATTVDSLGWTAEFRIPFSQLRFSEQVGGGRTWGFGIMREIARREERSTWSPWTRNSPGFVSAFGELHGLDAVRAPKRLEILPYTSARLERAPGDRTDPFYHSNALGAAVGADLRYGLPGGLTLTGTLNPDFGQVEVDPAVVNLSAFETFFPERRPFFLEGNDIFRFGDVVTHNSFTAPQFFYSRRIGRQPQRLLSGSEYAYIDAPEQSTILGAAKVSGKTVGGWSVGIMDAVTAREDARFRTTAGKDGTSPVEPLSNYFAGRLRRDFRRGRTMVGGLLTSTHRDMSDDVFSPLLRSSAYVAGIDAQHSWSQRRWTLSGFVAASQVRGSTPAVTALQRTSARYFQRPDADANRFDPTRTSLAGHVGAVALAHRGHWDGSVVYQETSPGFEANDLGYQSSADRRAFSTYLGRRVNQPRGAFRSYAYSASTTHAWNFDGDNVYADLSTSANGVFKNFWSAGLGLGFSPEVLSDRRTRGGPLSSSPREWYVSADLGTDRRKPVSATASVFHREGGASQYYRLLRGAVSLRPSTSLQVSLGPKLERDHTAGQYVLAVADTLARATFGRRYVFADVDRTTLSLDARVNWTFTPTLSLEIFAQPYLSAGDFDRYKEFLTPGGFEFGVYGQDVGTITRSGEGFVVDPDGEGPAKRFTVGNRAGQRDFNYRSLRGNAVLRWEYRPGSTLFFVWQQLRNGEYLVGDFDLGRDAPRIFHEPAQNVFLIKATYWLGQ